MSSQEQFTALLQQADPHAGYQLQPHIEEEDDNDDEEKGRDNRKTFDCTNSWVKGYGSTSPGAPPTPGQPISPKKNKPPQAPKRNGTSEQTPLLAPFPPKAAPQSNPHRAAPQSAPPKRHGRSSSDFVFTNPTSPLIGGPHAAHGGSALPPMHGHGGPPRNRAKPPLRAVITAGPIPANLPPPPPSTISPLHITAGSRGRGGAHRRVKSDIPNSLGGGRILISKQELLKNFPDPRWGGPMKVMHIGAPGHSRSGSEAGSLHSGHSGGALGQLGHPLLGSAPNVVGAMETIGTIGSVALDGSKKPGGMHVRARSDASLASVTTDMMKSTLFKGVTEKGTIQMQLPKDQFRLLMDPQLEAGYVYKRKLIDNEDEIFCEFHTVEEGPNPLNVASHACLCSCDRCNRCYEKQKRLPPALYVMAVDSSLYRRMLDEIIESQNMPCGTFFCGHHEDVAHPDVKIAAVIVSIVFMLLFAGTFLMKG